MPRPIQALIDPAALASNLQCVRARAPSTKLWAVIKANAYGHGITRVWPGLQSADGLAMLDLNEAVACRERGWTGPILLLEGFFERSDLQVLLEHRITTAVHCTDQLDWLAQAPVGGQISVWLKMNSGMNRLGFTPQSYQSAWERLQSLAQEGRVGTVGLMTHFATADGPQGVDWQLQIFDREVAQIPGPVSVANSAAVWRYGQARRDWARPGIILYGSSPFDDESAADMGLKPAQTLQSRVIGVQTLKPGDRVGYGGHFTASESMRIGVVACGYADGYPRVAPTGTPVVVDGVRTRVVGRVSMDMLTVDLTPVPQAGSGSSVVLWGAGGPSIDEVATAAGTLGYELMCALAPRVPVTVLDASSRGES